MQKRLTAEHFVKLPNLKSYEPGTECHCRHTHHHCHHTHHHCYHCHHINITVITLIITVIIVITLITSISLSCCCCCCCRPHSTNVLPAESSTRNHVAASSLSPQVARKGSTLSGFVQRSRLEREVGRDLHSNKWEEV